MGARILRLQEKKKNTALDPGTKRDVGKKGGARRKAGSVCEINGVPLGELTGRDTCKERKKGRGVRCFKVWKEKKSSAAVLKD